MLIFFRSQLLASENWNGGFHLGNQQFTQDWSCLVGKAVVQRGALIFNAGGTITWVNSKNHYVMGNYSWCGLYLPHNGLVQFHFRCVISIFPNRCNHIWCTRDNVQLKAPTENAGIVSILWCSMWMGTIPAIFAFGATGVPGFWFIAISWQRRAWICIEPSARVHVRNVCRRPLCHLLWAALQEVGF